MNLRKCTKIDISPTPTQLKTKMCRYVFMNMHLHICKNIHMYLCTCIFTYRSLTNDNNKWFQISLYFPGALNNFSESRFAVNQSWQLSNQSSHIFFVNVRLCVGLISRYEYVYVMLLLAFGASVIFLIIFCI